jgi:hypothetical protein
MLATPAWSASTYACKEPGNSLACRAVALLLPTLVSNTDKLDKPLRKFLFACSSFLGSALRLTVSLVPHKLWGQPPVRGLPSPLARASHVAISTVPDTFLLSVALFRAVRFLKVPYSVAPARQSAYTAYTASHSVHFAVFPGSLATNHQSTRPRSLSLFRLTLSRSPLCLSAKRNLLLCFRALSVYRF